MITGAENYQSGCYPKVLFTRTNIDEETIDLLNDVHDLQELMLNKCGITNCQLGEIAQLSSLRILHLSESQITDAGMEHFASLEQLRLLDISQNPKTIFDRLSRHQNRRITDEGLMHLGNLEQLSVLILGGNMRITDQGLEYLSDLSELSFLDIGDTGIRGYGLEAVSHSVKSLRFAGSGVNSQTLAYLSCLDNLEALTLAGCTNAATTALEKLSDTPLKVLVLRGPAFEDRSLNHIHVPLEKLELRNTEVSPAAIERFLSRFPDCKVRA